MKSNQDTDHHGDDDALRRSTAEEGLSMPQAPPSAPSHTVGPYDEPFQPTHVLSVNASDVLCGRGKVSINHAGNKHFRQLVMSTLSRFEQSADRRSRASTIQSIVNAVHATGGRFLKIDVAAGRWRELSNVAAKNKVGHALRHALSSTMPYVPHFSTPHSNSNSGTGGGSSSSSSGIRRGIISAAHPPDRAGYPNGPQVEHETLVVEPGIILPGLPGPEMTSRSLGGVPPPPLPGVLPWSQSSSLLSMPPPPPQQQQQLLCSAMQPQPEVNDNLRAGPGTADTNDHGFLNVINQTLGPMPSDATDPIQRWLG